MDKIEQNREQYIEAMILLILILIVLFVLISIIIRFSDNSCPSCNKWWAKKNMGRRELDRVGGYKTVTRHDIRRNSKSEEIGSIERQEQVYLTTIKYENHYECKHCQHRWSNISVSDIEGGVESESKQVLKTSDVLDSEKYDLKYLLQAYEYIEQSNEIEDLKQYDKKLELYFTAKEIFEKFVSKYPDTPTGKSLKKNELSKFDSVIKSIREEMGTGR